MLKALKPDISRGLVCQANGSQAMFAEQKEVNRHGRICHLVETVAVPEGAGAAANGAVHSATGDGGQPTV
jgi:hypothetical protein